MLNFYCRLSIFVFVGVFLCLPSTYAEIKTYVGVGEYKMSKYETPNASKQRAKLYALRSAQEQAAVHIKSYSKTINAKLQNDEIIVISAGIMQVIDTKYQTIPIDNGIKFIATVTANIDTDMVDEWLKRDPQEREILIAENKELQKSITKQEEQINNLKNLIANSKTVEDIENIKAEFAKIDDEFLSNQSMEEGNRYTKKRNYYKAIECYNKALENSPNKALVYGKRGYSYIKLGKYDNAIADYTKAIEISSTNNMTYLFYNSRGAAYYYLNEYQRAIEDFSNAIKLNPKDWMAYNNRGGTYCQLKNYDLAIKDLNKAIKLNPNYAEAYNNLGICYEELGEYAKAQTNFKKAKSLGFSSIV